MQILVLFEKSKTGHAAYCPYTGYCIAKGKTIEEVEKEAKRVFKYFFVNRKFEQERKETGKGRI